MVDTAPLWAAGEPERGQPAVPSLMGQIEAWINPPPKRGAVVDRESWGTGSRAQAGQRAMMALAGPPPAPPAKPGGR